jgi:hypothetical protein
MVTDLKFTFRQLHQTRRPSLQQLPNSSRCLNPSVIFPPKKYQKMYYTPDIEGFGVAGSLSAKKLPPTPLASARPLSARFGAESISPCLREDDSIAPAT